MDQDQKNQLAQSVEAIFHEVNATDATQLLITLNGNDALKERVLTEVSNFFQSQLQLSGL